jgi:hypothetical protein
VVWRLENVNGNGISIVAIPVLLAMYNINPWLTNGPHELEQND